MIDDAPLRIVTADRAGVEFAIGLAANEGWNPGLHDAAAFHAADPGGFLLGLLDGVPIGCISAVRYAERFGFIGLYIVVPEHRGKGYGIRLWQAAMERLAGCNVGLDGVVAQQPNYRRSGFKLAYSNIRFERSEPVRTTASATAGIVAIDDTALDRIARFDRSAFPSARDAFLRAWLHQPDSAALMRVDRGEIRGYGVIRKCANGSKIGPLFAADSESAEALYLALGTHATDDGPVYLDVPEVNAPAMVLAQKYAMRHVFGTARMYTGDAPPIALERVFGVTTFELG
jgi:GNAT superfamily N-acetyltransferase